MSKIRTEQQFRTECENLLCEQNHGVFLPAICFPQRGDDDVLDFGLLNLR